MGRCHFSCRSQLTGNFATPGGVARPGPGDSLLTYLERSSNKASQLTLHVRSWAANCVSTFFLSVRSASIKYSACMGKNFSAITGLPNLGLITQPRWFVSCHLSQESKTSNTRSHKCNERASIKVLSHLSPLIPRSANGAR